MPQAGLTAYVAPDLPPVPAELETQTPDKQRGIRCPNCGWFNEWGTKKTDRKPEGYTVRLLECKGCQTRIETAECFVRLAPQKKKRGG